jgi:hypothetical protein
VDARAQAALELCVGRLAGDGMKVEVEVEAHVPVGVSELDA